VLSAVPNPAAKEYILMTDWYANGNGVLNLPGVGRREMGTNPQTGKKTEISFGDLYMMYQIELARHEAELQGDSFELEKQQDGSYVAKVGTQARVGQG
jgi:hypothetical protein